MIAASGRALRGLRLPDDRVQGPRKGSSARVPVADRAMALQPCRHERGGMGESADLEKRETRCRKSEEVVGPCFQSHTPVAGSGGSLFQRGPQPAEHLSLGRADESLAPDRIARKIRTHPDFPQFAEDIGLVRCWQVHGWPPQVQPKPGTDGSTFNSVVADIDFPGREADPDRPSRRATGAARASSSRRDRSTLSGRPASKTAAFSRIAVSETVAACALIVAIWSR